MLLRWLAVVLAATAVLGSCGCGCASPAASGDGAGEAVARPRAAAAAPPHPHAAPPYPRLPQDLRIVYSCFQGRSHCMQFLEVGSRQAGPAALGGAWHCGIAWLMRRAGRASIHPAAAPGGPTSPAPWDATQALAVLKQRGYSISFICDVRTVKYAAQYGFDIVQMDANTTGERACLPACRHAPTSCSVSCRPAAWHPRWTSDGCHAHALQRPDTPCWTTCW
jgi:hypothetical protein